MSAALFLALDQGGSASRAIIYNEYGELITAAKQAVATTRPQAQWVEQSPQAVVASLQSVAAKAIAQLSEPQRQQLRACGLACQRSSLVCWDSVSNQPLSPIVSWQDTRASKWLAVQAIDYQTIYRLTGLYPNAHFGFSKMRWYLDHSAEVKSAATAGRLRMAPLAAYLVNQLLASQPYVVDPVNASRTLLMNINNADWDEGLLSQFAIGRELLPEIVRSENEFGNLELAGMTIPLRVVTGDQSAAAFVNGEPKAQDCHVIMGTGAFLYNLQAIPSYQHKLLNSILHWSAQAAQPRYIVEGTVNGAGSALQWLAKQYELEDLTQYMVALLADYQSNKAAITANSPLFINSVGGLGSPDWRANVAPQFIGDGNQQQQFIAVVESMLFLIMRNLLLMRKQSHIRRLVIGGGISQSDWVCQQLANLTGLIVFRGEQQEATARGLAFLLSNQGDQWVVQSGDQFSPQHSALQALRFQRWTQELEQRL